MKCSELLDQLVARPALYLGRESVPLAKAFLDGFEFAKRCEDSPARDLLYAGFQEWVAKRFQIKTAHDWASIIAFMGLSESGAFALMKELWHEYKTEARGQPVQTGP